MELPREARAQAERRRQPRRREDQLALARAEALTVREVARRSQRETLLADVELPRLKGDGQDRPQAPAGAPRILLVEDNDELRDFVARRLAAGYQVEEAKDGEAGLAAARRTTPDLIVSDVMMPGMDGHELCRRLRADPGLATVPVILLTARAGSDAIVEGLEVGADDYVVKPFALRELEARIAAHLRARETERQLHERESRLVAIGQMTELGGARPAQSPDPAQGLHGPGRTRLAVRGGESVIAEELEQVKAASDRLRRMIEEILDFARGGTPTLLLETLPARAFLDETLTPLAADLEERGIATEVHLRLDDDLKVTLDRDRMQRVLENLLRNAREAVMGGLESGGSFSAPGWRRATGWRSASRTPARASRTSWPAISSSSPSPRPARSRGPASAWSRCATWSRRTAARSASSPRPRRGRGVHGDAAADSGGVGAGGEAGAGGVGWCSGVHYGCSEFHYGCSVARSTVALRTRSRVLGWLLSHPGERYFVRQLAGILSEDPTEPQPRAGAPGCAGHPDRHHGRAAEVLLRERLQPDLPGAAQPVRQDGGNRTRSCGVRWSRSRTASSLPSSSARSPQGRRPGPATST